LAPDVFSAIGKPTTLIHAPSLCEAAILEAIRLGRVAIDLDGTPDRTLDLTASCAGAKAVMGGELTVGAGDEAAFEVTVHGVASGMIEVIRDGEIVGGPADASISPAAAKRMFVLQTDGAAHWVRINVRDGAGRLILIGNPIYLTPSNAPD
jgi:hypothetical protein